MKRFDVILVGDFRFEGGTSTAIAHELRALRSANQSVGLYHVNCAYLGVKRTAWHQDVAAEVRSGACEVVAEGTPVEAKVLFAHSPWIFQKSLSIRPRVTAPIRILVAHHAPVNARGRLYYDPWAIDRHASAVFGGRFVWAPISPVCRDAFDAAGLTFPRLRMDWTNLFFVDDWGAARSGLLGDVPVIGRHSQARPEKWPATRQALFQAYPDGGDIPVRLMGIAASVKALVGDFPSNWHTMVQGEMPVPDFLKTIDFFVYYTHPDWLETFGRTVAEAAAAGCVVIVPPYLKRTFGEAGVYRESSEALDLVRSLAADPERFANLSAHGRRAIDKHFGPATYIKRLQRLLDLAEGAIDLEDIVEQPTYDRAKSLRSQARRASFYWTTSFRDVGSKRSLKRQVKRLKRKWFH